MTATAGRNKKKGSLIARLFHKKSKEKSGVTNQTNSDAVLGRTDVNGFEIAGRPNVDSGATHASLGKASHEGAGQLEAPAAMAPTFGGTSAAGGRPGTSRTFSSGQQASSRLERPGTASSVNTRLGPDQPASPALVPGEASGSSPNSAAVAATATSESQPDCSVSLSLHAAKEQPDPCASLQPDTAEGQAKAAQAGREPAARRILHVSVLAARNVIPADNNGLSDPYCIVHVGSQKHTTRVDEKTLNPQWNECFVFGQEDIEEAVHSDAPRVRIEVYDWDLVSADDFLGQVEVEFSAAEGHQPREPLWIPLHRVSKHGQKTFDLGEIALAVWFQEGGQLGEAGASGGELSSLCCPPGQRKELPLVVHAKGNSLYEEPLIACLAVTLDVVRGAELGASVHLGPDSAAGEQQGLSKGASSSSPATKKISRFFHPFRRKRSNSIGRSSSAAYSSRDSEVSETASLDDDDLLELMSEEPTLVEHTLPPSQEIINTGDPLARVLEEDLDEGSSLPAAGGDEGSPPTAKAAGPSGHFLYCKLILGHQLRHSFVRRERLGSARFSQRFVFALPVPVRTDRQLLVELYRTPSTTRKGKLVASTQIGLYELLPYLAGGGPEGEPHCAAFSLESASKKAPGGEMVLQSVACDQDSRRAVWGPEHMGEAPTGGGRRDGHLLRRLQSRTRLPSARAQKMKATMTEESYQQWQERVRWAEQAKEVAGEAKELAAQHAATWGGWLQGWAATAASYIGIAKPPTPDTSDGNESPQDAPAPQAIAAPPAPRPPATLHLNIISLQVPQPLATADCFVVLKAGPHWGRSRLLTPGPQGRLDIAWELSLPLHDPSTLLLLTVFSQPRRFKGGQKINSGLGSTPPQLVGKLRVRLSCLQPNQQMAATLPLLSERKKGAQQSGTVALMLKVEYASGQALLKSYLAPSLPAPAYSHGCDDSRLQGVMSAETRRIVVRWLDSVNPAIPKPVALAVMDLEREEFQMSRLKANLRRFVLMAAGISKFRRWFDGVQRWDNGLESSLVAAALVLLAFRPSTVLPALLGWAAFSVACRKPESVGVLPMESDPPEVEPEDLQLATSSANPYTILMRKYEQLVGMMLRVQNIADDLASALEKLQALASWVDPVASTIFVATLTGLALIIYYVGLSSIVGFALFWVVRPPRLRTPTPSPPANLFKRLPSRADRIM